MKTFNSHYGELKGDRKYWSSLFKAKKSDSVAQVGHFCLRDCAPLTQNSLLIMSHYWHLSICTKLKMSDMKNWRSPSRVLRYSNDSLQLLIPLECWMIEYFIWIPLLIETYRNIPHANGKKSKQNSVPLIFDCYFYAQELIERYLEKHLFIERSVLSNNIVKKVQIQ